MTTSPVTKRLSEFSHGGGCACKLGPGLVAEILGGFTPGSHPDLLVGTETGDDAAVWRLDQDRALVATTDFFTPLVDDPRTWGQIAAVNAISDVYAMGGRPLFALNLVAWPSTELPMDMLSEVLAGGADIGARCGFAVVGGHSVDDPEPKYGLAVVGEVHPERILTNAGLRAGDSLVLTKALGTGTITSAIKQGTAPASVAAEAIASMTQDNAVASRAALTANASAATDVTGFGLLGHLRKMVEASGVDVELNVDAVPFIPGARELAQGGVLPSGSRRNRDWAAERLDAGARTELDVLLLADAQTSGGLLFGAMPDAARGAVSELGEPAAVIGEVRAGSGRILLR